MRAHTAEDAVAQAIIAEVAQLARAVLLRGESAQGAMWLIERWRANATVAEPTRA